MNKTYEISLSPTGIKDYKEKIFKMDKAIRSEDFKKYIANKMEKALVKIQRENLNMSTIMNNDLTDDIGSYMNSNHLEIDGDTIYIYNNAKIDIASKNMQETTKQNYPAQLSLAKIVEYGIGYTGGANTQHQGTIEDWQYDVNNHGFSGWYYTNDNGEVVWTNGYEGRLIFYKLKEHIKDNIYDWIEDYLEKIY